jgi:hypothetical protein
MQAFTNAIKFLYYHVVPDALARAALRLVNIRVEDGSRRS